MLNKVVYISYVNWIPKCGIGTFWVPNYVRMKTTVITVSDTIPKIRAILARTTCQPVITTLAHAQRTQQRVPLIEIKHDSLSTDIDTTQLHIITFFWISCNISSVKITDICNSFTCYSILYILDLS